MSKWEKWMTIFPTILTSKWRWGLSITQRSNGGVALVPGADPLLQNMQGLTAWDLALGEPGGGMIGMILASCLGGGFTLIPAYFSMAWNLKPPPGHIAIQFDVETTIGE